MAAEGNPASEKLVKLEPIVARQLLDAHERGMTIRLLLRWNAKRYILSLVPVIPSLIIMHQFGQRSGLATILGILAWMAFQEYRSLREQVQSWKVLNKALDWEMVREMV